jgi:hypothetical protein
MNLCCIKQKCIDKNAKLQLQNECNGESAACSLSVRKSIPAFWHDRAKALRAG